MSSLVQLVLDFFVFCNIHTFILIPLITHALNFISQGSSATQCPSTIIKSSTNTVSKNITNNSNMQNADMTDEKFCDKCEKLIDAENEEYELLTWRCRCNCCATCLEKTFAKNQNETDWPLRVCGCSIVGPVSLRDALSEAGAFLSAETFGYFSRKLIEWETMGEIDVDRYDYLLDEDDEDLDSQFKDLRKTPSILGLDRVAVELRYENGDDEDLRSQFTALSKTPSILGLAQVEARLRFEDGFGI